MRLVDVGDGDYAVEVTDERYLFAEHSMCTTVRRDETTLEELYGNEETHRIATDEFADFLAGVIAAVQAT